VVFVDGKISTLEHIRMTPQLTVNKIPYRKKRTKTLLHNLVYDSIDGDDDNYIMMKMKKKE